MKDSNTETGAVRSADAAHLSFTSLPMVGLLALARTAGEGATKYGRYNYMLGFPVHDLLDHVMAHVVNFLAGDRTEPHLAHAAWGLLAAIQAEILNPELSTPHLLGPGSTVTDAMRAYLAEQAPILAARRASGALDSLGNWKVEELPEVKKILDIRAAAAREADEETGTKIRRDGLQERLHEAMRKEGYRPRDLLPIPDGMRLGEVAEAVTNAGEHVKATESRLGLRSDSLEAMLFVPCEDCSGDMGCEIAGMGCAENRITGIAS